MFVTKIGIKAADLENVTKQTKNVNATAEAVGLPLNLLNESKNISCHVIRSSPSSFWPSPNAPSTATQPSFIFMDIPSTRINTFSVSQYSLCYKSCSKVCF